jgi:hypothetical protein
MRTKAHLCLLENIAKEIGAHAPKKLLSAYYSFIVLGQLELDLFKRNLKISNSF